MYRVLFGKDAEVPRPCKDVLILVLALELTFNSDCDIRPDPGHFAKLEDCLLQILPEKLPQDINEGLMRVKQPLDEDQQKRLPEIIRHALEEAIPDCLNKFFSSMPSSMPHTVDSGYVSVEPEPSEVGQPSTERYTPNCFVPNADNRVPFTGTESNQIVGYAPSHTSGAFTSHDISNGATSVDNVLECYDDFSTLLYPLEPWQVVPPEITGTTEFASNLRPLQEMPSSVGERNSQQYRNPHADPSIMVPPIIINPREQVGENAGRWDQFGIFEYSAGGPSDMSQQMGAVGKQRVTGNSEQGVGRIYQSWDVPGRMN